MKILCVSDYAAPALNDRLESGLFSDIDLILSCGDLSPEYLTSLKGRFGVPLFYVKGNHDIRYDLSPPVGCMNLDGRIIRHRGLNFLGLEGSHWYNGGPYQYTESQMRRRIRRLRFNLWLHGGIDVVIAHAPPRHIHDAEDPCHMGFESFLRIIDRYRPRYFIHGHIHADFSDAAQRISVARQTKVVNTYGYYLFEVDSEKD